MPKLPKRLPYEFAMLAALALSSCNERMTPARISERAEIADINARNALAGIEELDSRISEIESKLNM